MTNIAGLLARLKPCPFKAVSTGVCTHGKTYRRIHAGRRHWEPGSTRGDSLSRRGRLRGRVRSRRHWLGELEERGQSAAGAHHRVTTPAQSRAVRRDHVETKEGIRGRSHPRAAGQGPAVFQPHRVNAAD